MTGVLIALLVVLAVLDTLRRRRERALARIRAVHGIARILTH